jgi:hypothetical protein
MRSPPFVAMLLVILSIPSVAFAQDPPERIPLVPVASAPAEADEATSPADRVYYRWQSFGVDLAALGMFALAGKYNSDPIGYAGLGTYALGTPILHLAHGHPGRALGSAALRIVAPVAVGTVVYYAQGSCSPSVDDCDLGHGIFAVYGAVLTGVLVAVLDDAAFSYDEVARASGPIWNLSAAPTPGGFNVGVSGTF